MKQESGKDKSNLMALYSGSRVYVRKEDILKIFCDKPALYSVRLAELVFGVTTLRKSCMPGENVSNRVPLDADMLDSIITHVVQVFKQQNKVISRGFVKNSIQMRLSGLSNNQ